MNHCFCLYYTEQLCLIDYLLVTHFFNKHLFGAYSVPSTMLGTGDIVGNRAVCEGISCHQMGKCVWMYFVNLIILQNQVVFSLLH